MSRDLTLRTDPEALTVVSVTVASGQTVGTSTANDQLIGGRIISVVPTTNQDQLVKSAALGATGIVTITLGTAATANNVLNVVVQKP